jgi:hypothetical protein
MPPGNVNAAAAAALQDQIDNLGARMDKGFDEIKALVRSFDERVRGVEMQEAGCKPIITSRVDASWRKLDEHDTTLGKHDERIKTLDKQLGRLMSMYGIFVFIGGGLGLSVIALIWSLITGQATVVFR